jgi:hypothetical protein
MSDRLGEISDDRERLGESISDDDRRGEERG